MVDDVDSDAELPTKEVHPRPHPSNEPLNKRSRSTAVPREVASFYAQRDVQRRMSRVQQDMFPSPQHRERALRRLRRAGKSQKPANPTTDPHADNPVQDNHAPPPHQKKSGVGDKTPNPPPLSSVPADAAPLQEAVQTRKSPAPPQPQRARTFDHGEDPDGLQPLHKDNGDLVDETTEDVSASRVGDEILVPENTIVQESTRTVHVDHIEEEDDTVSASVKGSVTASTPAASAKPRGVQHHFKQVSIRELNKRMRSVVRWGQMLSCVAVSGRVRLTAYQYNFFVRAMTTANAEVNMRQYRSVTSSFWKKMVAYAFPASHVHFIHSIPRLKNVRLVKTTNDGMKHPGDCVRIVLPSEWARVDISNVIFFRKVFETEGKSSPEVCSIDNSPIVRNRRIVNSAELVVWALYDSAVCPCEVGDKVRFPSPHSPLHVSGKPFCSTWSSTATHGPESNGTEGLVGHVWCVTNSDATTPSTALSTTEKEVFELLNAQVYTSYAAAQQGVNLQQSIEQSVNANMVHVCIGDICVLLRPPSPTNTSTTFCLLVASPVMNAYGGATERLIWVEIARPQHRNAYVRLIAKATVNGLPTWLSGQRAKPHFSTGPTPNKGNLPDGMPYYIYRIALYADGFQQHKSMTDTRSVTGVYMIPLGLPMSSRRSSSASRVITLIPHGVKENDVFKHIEDDLFKATTEGVLGVDPYGSVSRIFVDFVSFYGDYPAVTSMTDARGHTGSAFCTFCSMRKRVESCGRNLVYSTHMHSRRLGFMRFDGRTEAIRKTDPPADIIKALGLSKKPPTEAVNAPLARYSRRVREAIRNGTNAPHDFSFDSCLNIAAAPDHLLTGLIADVFHVCFMTLESNEDREKMELLILHNADANNLDHEGRFLKWENGSVKGLRGMTMSTRISLLMCSVTPFKKAYASLNKEEFLLPAKLQDIISHVYYAPSEEVEGPEARAMVTDEGILRSQRDRVQSVRTYVESCARIFRSNTADGKRLSKPNAHRALELCILTIPSFGHARNCSEMVLESTHRDFKHWLETNTHADAHITGIERTLLRDWLNRVHGLFLQWSNGGEETSERAERGLLRLLLGKDGLYLNPARAGAGKILANFRAAMEDAFRDPVLDEMPSTEQWGDPVGSAYEWKPTKGVDDGNPTETAKTAFSLLEEWYAYTGRENIDLLECKSARFMVTDGVTGVRRAYPYSKVSSGCAVSIFSRPHRAGQRVIRGAAMSEEGGTMRFYVVYNVVRVSCGDCWCAVKELKPHGEGYAVLDERVAVLLLGQRVRRVGLIHICDDACAANVGGWDVRHSSNVLRGGVYQVITRKDGYPPHLG